MAERLENEGLPQSRTMIEPLIGLVSTEHAIGVALYIFKRGEE